MHTLPTVPLDQLRMVIEKSSKWNLTKFIAPNQIRTCGKITIAIMKLKQLNILSMRTYKHCSNTLLGILGEILIYVFTCSVKYCAPWCEAHTRLLNATITWILFHARGKSRRLWGLIVNHNRAKFTRMEGRFSTGLEYTHVHVAVDML